MRKYDHDFSWSGTVTSVDANKKLATITMSSPSEANNDTLMTGTRLHPTLTLNASVSGTYTSATNKVVIS